MLLEITGGTDTAELVMEDTNERIGNRIRTIREAKGLSREELGVMVGLNSNRIQQYENGARKPKIDLLKKFAGALGVETLALIDPSSMSYISAMFVLFELEDRYDMKLIENDGKIMLSFDNFLHNSLSEYIKEWYEEYKLMQSHLEVATTEEEKKQIIYDYNMWKWTFPKALTDRTAKGLKKAKIKSKIEELQAELKKMEE